MDFAAIPFRSLLLASVAIQAQAPAVAVDFASVLRFLRTLPSSFTGRHSYFTAILSNSVSRLCSIAPHPRS